MDTPDLLDLAALQLDGRVRAIGNDQWHLPTPCDGWTVTDLVGHLVGGCRMAAALLTGADTDEAMRARELPIDGPIIEALREALDVQREAFRVAEGEPDGRLVHHPVFEMTVPQLRDQRLVELVVHHWDLDRSLAGPGIVDPRLADAAWGAIEPLAGVTGQLGMFGAGPSGTLPVDATLLERLLDALGRRP